jgi:hypothetical protein
MRAMMLCGAALMKQDERLPFLIAEFLTESTSMQDIQRIISSTLPQQDTGEMARLLRRFCRPPAVAVIYYRRQAAQRRKTAPPCPEPAEPEDKNLEETRKNIQHLFPDDD